MMTLEMKLDECFMDGFKKGFEEGYKEGFKKGFEEGRIEGRNEILLHMLKSDLPISDISEISDTSEAEILELKHKIESE